jgi:hypothetical protein
VQITGSITLKFDFDVPDDRFSDYEDAKEFFENNPHELMENVDGPEEVELEDTWE